MTAFVANTGADYDVQSIFVRSVVESIYGVHAARQVIAMASEQNLSVIQVATDLVIQRKVKRKALASAPKDKPVNQPAAKKPAAENTTCYAVSIEEAAYIVADRIDLMVCAESSEPAFIQAASDAVFVTRKPQRKTL